MRGAISPFPITPSWRGAQLKKHKDNITITFILFFINLYLYLQARQVSPDTVQQILPILIVVTSA
jgi:uncharacterized membrane protein YozB (DUF420 family)